MQTIQEKAAWIKEGKAVLAIELGSTRIKAVVIGKDHSPIAQGGHSWENHNKNGVWTYSLEEVWAGLCSCYGDLAQNVRTTYGVELRSFAAIGISAMMHGYLAFDREDRQLAEFRTWRNTMTGEAAAELSELLQFNIPQRWSLAHLYQAILNGEEHVQEVAYLTTLSGYVHWKLTGRKVLGIGDASGMFPVDSDLHDFDRKMLEKYQTAAAGHGWQGDVFHILPQVLCAGEDAGILTEEGALLLDPSGRLEAGIPMAPPEGDAGTGMVATNSVARGTGNVSAGTSVFSMVVLEKTLSDYYEQIDLVTTPAGRPVAMVHCNNCTNEINAWAGLLEDFLQKMGYPVDRNRLYEVMFGAAASAAADCGQVYVYNYLAGEPVVGVEEGRPLMMRTAQAEFTFSNLMLSQLYAAVSTLQLGMRILEKEGVSMRRLYGHGGYFKTTDMGQRVLAAALNVPVAVMETAGEGGAWGMALLAAYLCEKQKGQSLENFLAEQVFRQAASMEIAPDPELRAGYERYIAAYEAGLGMMGRWKLN